MTASNRMNAARVIETPLGRDIRTRSIGVPEVVPHAMKVQVMAAGCGFQDLAMLRGEYHVDPPLPYTPLGEFSGVVTEIGDGVEGFRPGDRVFGVCGLNCAAEYAVVPPGFSYRMSDGMPFDEAAAFCIAYPTAYAAVAIRARLEAGETLLVAGAAGGVGLAAIQIGKALGARVLAVASSAEKQMAAKEAGADEVLGAEELEGDERPPAEALADVVLDPVGGTFTDCLLKRVRWGARLVTLGFASGTIPQVSLNRLLLKNVSVVGLNWASYGIRQQPEYHEAFEWLLDGYGRGALRPRIFRRYGIAQVGQALADIRERRVIGKNVVLPQGLSGVLA